MPTNPDVLCAGGCGRLRWRSRSGVPGTCRECRARGFGPILGVRLCEVDGCERKHFAIGLCRNHYRQRDDRKRYRQQMQERGQPPRVRAMIGALAGDGRGLALVSERVPHGGVLVWCVCGACMGVPVAAPRWVRECVQCGKGFRVNEVELALYESGQVA